MKKQRSKRARPTAPTLTLPDPTTPLGCFLLDFRRMPRDALRQLSLTLAVRALAEWRLSEQPLRGPGGGRWSRGLGTISTIVTKIRSGTDAVVTARTLRTPRAWTMRLGDSLPGEDRVSAWSGPLTMETS
eukprot:3630833-Rhodomonas_salina.1